MIGIGIIGAGHFGAVHARALTGVPGARLVAACRNDQAGIEAFTLTHGGTPYTDWQKLLADPAVDAVVIATPHHLHREIAVAALAANKHVLLEKPMATTLADCDAIAAAGASSAGLFMVGHVPRYFLPMQAATDVLAEGSLGRPIAGTSAFLKLWMEANRQPWHLSKASGGGMLMTAGIHALDRLVYLMGGEVAAVGAMLSAAFHEQEADDTAFVNLRFRDGRFGQLSSVGYAQGAGTAALQLFCENGTLLLDLEGQLRTGRDGHWQDLPCPTEADPMTGAVRREWQAFIDAIGSSAPSPIDAAYARHLVAITDAAQRSSTERREIDVEPAST